MDNQNQQSHPIQSQSSTLPGVGNLLKRTWQVYRTRLGVFLGIMSLPVILSFLAIFLERLLRAPEIPLFYFLFLIVLLILLIIFHFWSQVSLIFAIKEREEKIGIIESLRKIFALIWISFLVGFIVTGGFGLFVIPGTIFSVWFALAPYVLVSEGRKGMEALFRSKNLVSGNWWGVFGDFL